MLTLIDSSAQYFDLHERRGDRNYYLAREPWLMLIVAHNDLTLADCAGKVCDCSLGWHEASYGFVRPENSDKRHSKLTIRAIHAGARDSATPLSRVLGNAPRE